MSLCSTLIALSIALGVVTLPNFGQEPTTPTEGQPYAWVFSNGQVVASNLSDSDLIELVEDVSLLLNYPGYRIVTNYQVYCDTEDLSSRIYVMEGADYEDLVSERLRLEVENFHTPGWGPPKVYYLEL